MTAAVCPGAPTDIVNRLLARTVDDGGCLVWQGSAIKGCPNHRSGMVRRTLFTELVGPLKGTIGAYDV